MGILMVTQWYPPEKSAEVAKLILKQPKELPYITKWRVFNTSGGLDGIKSYHLIYTERGKLEETMTELAKYLIPFYNIGGFRYQIEPLVGTSDSFSIFGMKWE